jgi:hypothetical protein
VKYQHDLTSTVCLPVHYSRYSWARFSIIWICRLVTALYRSTKLQYHEEEAQDPILQHKSASYPIPWQEGLFRERGWCSSQTQPEPFTIIHLSRDTLSIESAIRNRTPCKYMYYTCTMCLCSAVCERLNSG